MHVMIVSRFVCGGALGGSQTESPRSIIPMQSHPVTAPSIIKRSTSRSFSDVCGTVEAVCQEFDFGLIGTIDLKAKMNAKGVPFKRNCTVFEVCNPKIAAGVLELNLDLANAMPRRVAIYEAEGKTVVTTLRPTRLIELFDAPGTEEHADTVEATMTGIIARLTE